MFAMVFDAIKAMNEKNKMRNEQIALLEQRVQELESQPALHYEGVWVPGKAYGVNAAVTCRGNLWNARMPTALEPGSADSNWQLAVRKGRDARDLR